MGRGRLVFDLHEVHGNVPVNGMCGADASDLEPIDRLEREADAVVEVVVTVFDLVVVVDRTVLIIDVDGGAVGPSRGFVAVADHGRDVQPRQYRDLITRVDGQRRVVVVEDGLDPVAPTVFGRLIDEIDVNAHQRDADAASKTIVGVVDVASVEMIADGAEVQADGDIIPVV